MPCSLIETSNNFCGGGDGGDVNGRIHNFKLNEHTFLASLMPKKEIGADRFIEAHPHYDGRGAVIAIFDSGVDPAASGLQLTSDGKPKILDVIDCTGSGDVDTSKVVKADKDGRIQGASGASLVVNSSWKNPSGEWHVGYKLIYELFTDTLTSRIKKERKRKWDEKNQEEIAKAVLHLDEFDQKYTKVEDLKLKRAREDLQNRIDLLKKQGDSYDDKGPVIDAVVWHDGELWRVALDTQSLHDDRKCGKLADFVPLTNYRIEQKYGIFSELDACTFVVNVYDEGNILSIVTDCSPHATHVAGIATAFHPQEPLLNGVAPGAQIISCKIGDARLGSMETGTGLTRALIAAVEHKCDLINMSYGEPTLLPDYGRFVDLVNEVVNKYRLIFVSSAGNSGPALSTVGAPGGTSSSIIGVGAYVSPAMAAGAHSVVEPPPEGLEYTWSSRGPTADGDLGVCISAPGGAVAPVPTWTLQGRMLMNGTSMASPSACGGIALLISAMKAEGIPVSPYSVRIALENTSIPVGGLPEDKLTAGQGLMQVDKAYEYIQRSQDLSCVCYQIKVNQSGKSTPISRGIYLREATACQQSTEWAVQVEPRFHDDASKLDQLVPFEECIELRSSNNAVVRAPEYLLLTHNGRTFNVVVDPSNLADGLHYYEVYGIDCKASWRGPLFRIPITITKPKAVLNRPPLVSFSKMSFLPGHIERRYIEVPLGASWVEATMRTSGFDTSRRFFVDTVQLCPLRRPIKWESVVTFSSPTAKSFDFPVVGGQTMELAIAQFWSSGMGSHETTIVDFEIVFHGIGVNRTEVVLDGSEAPIRIEAEALLASERLVPTATLNKIRVPFRPTEAKLCTLPTNRDKLPSGKQILALTLTYHFKLEDGGEVRPHIPLLNNRIYDTKFESQFYMISDTNKRVYAMGDCYPASSQLPKGEYTLRLYLRHDNVQYLEKMKQLVLFLERNLEEKDVIPLNFFSEPDGPVMGNGTFKYSILVPGIKESFYLSPPNKDKLPKCSSLMLPTPPTFTKMASMAFPVVQSPRNSTPIFSSNKEKTQNWNALKFVRGKKLLKDLSTWGIGGPCNYFVQVFHQTHLLSAIRYCREFSIPYVVIGKGSNCLFDDLGFDGCVILNQIDFLERMEPGVYRAGSGFRFNHLGSLSCNEGFTGLEFAAGIPGTVGGATYMNAGANGQETANVIESIDIVTTEGNFRTLNRIDLTFGYRSSSFQDMDNLAAIVAVTFRLEHSGSAKKRQQELLKRRRATQPVNERSAGSVFRNPVNLGVSAAELIDKAGLKGCSIGGAMVSNIHANFLVNNGAATSQDMLNLIALVKDKVHSKFGVELEEEVLYFHPYWNYAKWER